MGKNPNVEAAVFAEFQRLAQGNDERGRVAREILARGEVKDPKGTTYLSPHAAMLDRRMEMIVGARPRLEGDRLILSAVGARLKGAA